MEGVKIHVALFTVPQAACDSEKMNWNDVASLVNNQLFTAFGEHVLFEHIEFMSKTWFANDRAQVLLEKGEVNFPFVLVNDEVACSEKKVNLSKVRRHIQLKLQT